MKRYNKGMSLTDTMALVGLTHAVPRGQRNGKEIYNANGVCVAVATADEMWDWFYCTGRIRE